MFVSVAIYLLNGDADLKGLTTVNNLAVTNNLVVNGSVTSDTPIVGVVGAYGYVYEIVVSGPGAPPQVAAGNPLPFSNNGALFNISHVPGSTALIIPQAGVYRVTFSVEDSGSIISTFSIASNGIRLAGGTFGAGTGATANQVIGDAIVTLNAGSSLSIITNEGVTFNGVDDDSSSASLVIEKIG